MFIIAFRKTDKSYSEVMCVFGVWARVIINQLLREMKLLFSFSFFLSLPTCPSAILVVGNLKYRKVM